ncbi:MAG: dehydrogenase [Holophagaceae bacterium]|nr:dehydrogenase [Holophagaceae bacterium]
MNVLIVYAHEEPHSFNAALKNTAIRHFESRGHKVVVSDLYRMKFKAVADGDDFLERRNKYVLTRQHEEAKAHELGTLSHDILLEQKKVHECDLLILQFPLWWFSMPAILKGWVDRVMTLGFAYGNGKWYDRGGLQGRRAMLSITTGGPEHYYSERGINGDLERILYPIHHGILFFCGFTVLPPHVAWSPAHIDKSTRHQLIEAYEKHLSGIEGAEPMCFHPLSHYGEDLRLKEEFNP